MDTTSTQPIIRAAIHLAGGTQASLAEKAKISQNAVWKLLTGKTKRPTFPTAVGLERAVNGRISRYEFMEMKQGESNGDSHELLRLLTDEYLHSDRFIGESELPRGMGYEDD